MSPPPPASGMAAAAEASTLEDTLVDKEQVVKGFASIDWESYGRTTLSADEVRVDRSEKGGLVYVRAWVEGRPWGRAALGVNRSIG